MARTPVRVQGTATNRAGKIIATWPVSTALRVPAPAGAKPAEHWLVTVKLVNEDQSMVLHAHCPALPEVIKHTDVEQLRLLVEQALVRQVNLITKATWEPWLEVVVRSQGFDRAYQRKVGTRENGLTITVNTIMRGTVAGDPRVYTINFNNVATPFPSPKRAGEKDDGDDDSMFSTGRPQESEYSYVRATPENIAAMDDLQSRLMSVGAQLSSFLRQDAVSASLAQVASGQPLLPLSGGAVQA